MNKAKKKYQHFVNLYYTTSFLQFIIIAVYLFIIFSKGYVYIVDIVKNRSAFNFASYFLPYFLPYLLPYLPVIAITILTLLLSFMLISLVILLVPIVLNDFCKERRFLLCKFSALYSFSIYTLSTFLEKGVSGYVFNFSITKIDMEFLFFLFLHLLFFILLCVLSHKTKTINIKLANTIKGYGKQTKI